MEYINTTSLITESMLKIKQELEEIENGDKETNLENILDLKSLFNEYEKAKLILSNC